MPKKLIRHAKSHSVDCYPHGELVASDNDKSSIIIKCTVECQIDFGHDIKMNDLASLAATARRKMRTAINKHLKDSRMADLRSRSAEGCRKTVRQHRDENHKEFRKLVEVVRNA